MILSEGGRLSSKKCIAANSGGGAWVNSGDVIQQGGTLAFEDCEAKQFGGGMYIKGTFHSLMGGCFSIGARFKAIKAFSSFLKRNLIRAMTSQAGALVAQCCKRMLNRNLTRTS